MPRSAHEGVGPEPTPPPGQGLAVAAESLYLTNLLLLPGLAFVALLVLYRRYRTFSPLVLCHLRQTLSASIWAGGLLGVFSVVVVLLLGYQFPYTWLFVLLYFVTFHSLFVLLGMLGLARAMAGQHYRYPLFGVRCDEVGR